MCGEDQITASAIPNSEMTTQSSTPDFYISSAEHRGEWAKPRAAFVERVSPDRQGVGHVWVRISPSAEIAGELVDELVIGPHFEGSSVWPVSRFPVPVYVYVPKAEDNPTHEVFDPADYSLVAWGELYEKRADAERVAARQSE